MKTSYTNVRICSKIRDSEYNRLKDICQQYGFKSVYQIIQTLIQVTLRAIYVEKDYQYTEGVPVELTKMITDALNRQKRAAKKKDR